MLSVLVNYAPTVQVEAAYAVNCFQDHTHLGCNLLEGHSCTLRRAILPEAHFNYPFSCPMQRLLLAIFLLVDRFRPFRNRRDNILLGHYEFHNVILDATFLRAARISHLRLQIRVGSYKSWPIPLFTHRRFFFF
jgi:hypothetical protein